MSDNPFAEPEDDRTVFRPMPGGQRNAARLAARQRRAGRGATPAPEPSAEDPLARPATDPLAERAPAPVPPPPIGRGADLQTLVEAFTNPLIASAQPLLQLLARLHNAAVPPDGADMRERAARELREFERRARDAGRPTDELRPAHYALCASLDDVVLNTPWGARSGWAERKLATSFHNDRSNGAAFFDQIRVMRADPKAHANVLELMYVCMGLGFAGPFRAAPDSAERMERIIAQTYDLIRTARGRAPGPLSEHWRGEDAPYRPRRTRFPVWVAYSIAVAALALGLTWLLRELNASSDAVLAGAIAAPPASMPAIERPPSVRPPPPPPEPPPPGPAERLRAGLGAEIARKEVEVIASPSAATMRLSADALFAPASATLKPGAEALLGRIGALLAAEKAPAQVLGYTDNKPSRTVRFPSNFALSKAQAEAARNALVAGGAPAASLTAEGRAEAEAVGNNASNEGRAQNRRIDIVLTRPGAP